MYLVFTLIKVSFVTTMKTFGKSLGNQRIGFPGGSVVKNPPAEDVGSVPRTGRSPGGGNGNPLQCSCLENPRDVEPGGLPSTGLHRVRHD